MLKYFAKLHKKNGLDKTIFAILTLSRGCNSQLWKVCYCDINYFLYLCNLIVAATDSRNLLSISNYEKK